MHMPCPSKLLRTSTGQVHRLLEKRNHQKTRTTSGRGGGRAGWAGQRSQRRERDEEPVQVLHAVLHAGRRARLPHVPEAEARVVADRREHVGAVRVRVEVAHRLPGVRALHTERGPTSAQCNGRLCSSQVPTLEKAYVQYSTEMQSSPKDARTSSSACRRLGSRYRRRPAPNCNCDVGPSARHRRDAEVLRICCQSPRPHVPKAATRHT